MLEIDAGRAAMKYLREAVDNMFKETEDVYLPFVEDELLTDLYEEQISGIPGTVDILLYRYSKADIWNLNNLFHEQLYPNVAENLNDAYEGVLHYNLTKLSKNEREDIGRSVRLSCFSETPDNQLMWGHYADGCRGICVEYNLCWLDDDTEALKRLLPVHYTDAKKVKEKPTFIHYIEDDPCTSLFITKSNEWSYEKEWRIILPTSFDAVSPIPFKCASKVILGAKMEDSMREFVTMIVDNVNRKRGKDLPQIIIEEQRL